MLPYLLAIPAAKITNVGALIVCIFLSYFYFGLKAAQK